MLSGGGSSIQHLAYRPNESITSTSKSTILYHQPSPLWNKTRYSLLPDGILSPISIHLFVIVISLSRRGAFMGVMPPALGGACPRGQEAR